MPLDQYLNLKLISFNSETITEEECTKLLLPAFAVSSWRFLILTNTNLPSNVIPRMMKILPSTSLIGLYLSLNNLFDDSIREIASVLDKSNLETLCLSCNNISDVGAKEISLVLTKSRLHDLSLDSNYISDIGAKCLADNLPNSNLQTLNLSYNKISDAGIKELTHAMKFRSNLVSIEGNLGNSFQVLNRFYEVLEIQNTPWFQMIILLCSTHNIPRIASVSHFNLFPKEILKELAWLLTYVEIDDDEELSSSCSDEDKNDIDEDYWT